MAGKKAVLVNKKAQGSNFPYSALRIPRSALKKPVRVVIIDDKLDDWRLVLEGLPWRAGERRPSSLGISPPPVRLELLASFNSMFPALPLLEQGGVGVVLLGAGLPWFEGQPCARFLQRRWPKLVVILVPGKNATGRDLALAPEEFPCLPQNFTGEELVAVITNAIRAARGLAELAGSLAPSPTFSARQIWIQEKNLKPREVQALNLIREGLLDKEIVERTGWSEPITKWLLRCAYAKLGVHHRAEAIKIWNTAPQ